LTSDGRRMNPGDVMDELPEEEKELEKEKSQSSTKKEKRNGF